MKLKTAALTLGILPATVFLSKMAVNFSHNQYRTIKNVHRLDNNIYLMDYCTDYNLDGLLKKGVSSVAELLSYVSKINLYGVNVFKSGSGDFACSTFNTVNEDGDYLFGRNFDYKKAPCMVVWTHPDNGYASIAVADCNFMLYGDVNKPSHCFNRLQTLLAPYCCMDGMNEKGLAIGILELKTKPTNQNTGKADISTTVLIRGVLDKCANVDEAISFFGSYDVHDAFFCNYHYQITDASGKSVIIEYVNNEMRLFYPEVKENQKFAYQYATNYFLSEDGDNSKAFGYDRAEKIDAKLSENGGVLKGNEALNLLKDVKLNYRHETYPWQVITLWSAVYNSNKLTAKIAAGLDYDSIYTFSVTKPCKVEYTSEPAACK